MGTETIQVNVDAPEFNNKLFNIVSETDLSLDPQIRFGTRLGSTRRPCLMPVLDAFCRFEWSTENA